MKFTWLGPKKFFDHRRTLLIVSVKLLTVCMLLAVTIIVFPSLQLILLIVISTEAFIVLIRRKSHIRITKALRPVFFIDSHYLFGVRRSDRPSWPSHFVFIDVTS